MLALAQLLVVHSLHAHYDSELNLAETNDFSLLVVLFFCHVSELNWVMQEGAQEAPFPVPRRKWTVHKSSVSTRIDLDKEGMRLSA